MSLGIGDAMGTGDLFVLVGLGILFVPNPVVGTPAQMFPFDGPAWSVFFELAANIFYAYTLRFLTNRVLMAIMLLSAAGLAGCLCVLPGHSLNVGFTVKSSPAGFCRAGYSFFTGVFLYRLFVSKKASMTKRKPSLVVPGGIVTLIATLLLSSPGEKLVPYFDFACVVLVFPALICAALHFEMSGAGARVCRFLGTVSYALYAVHDPVFHAIKAIADREHVAINNYAPWAGLGILIFLIWFCWLLDMVYDLPVRRFLQARLLR
jgi:peptidoglycan/LPS O-acetylase OafA/YrhL